MTKIATWNVNGIRASFEKGLHEFVKKHSPDILCLQEIKAHPDQLDKKIKLSSIYPYSYWSASILKKGYSGTATYCKKAPLNMQEGIGIKKYDWEGRVLITEHKSFVLLNIYFPNGALREERHLFKQEFLKRLVPFLKRLKKKTKKELIVTGDYNVAHLDIDVYSPQTLQNTSGFLAEERDWFTAFLDEGFIDVFRHFHPKKTDTFTWWSLREKARDKNRGWRIDHFCVSQQLKTKLKNITVHSQQMGSDHCPLTLTLSI